MYPPLMTQRPSSSKLFGQESNPLLMGVPKISFSNSRLFPHANDPLLQEIPSKLVEHQSGANVRGHVELHLPVRGAVVVAYHAMEVLADAEGMSYALRR
ncbi:hypothetical protein HKD37_17G047729 [Glycine soja]